MTVSKTKSRSVNMSDNLQAETIEAAKFSLINAIQKYLEKALREAGIVMNGKDSKKNSDGSITHKLTFMYKPEGADEDIEVEFYVNGKPTDSSKEYVDLSFMYPDFKADSSGQTIKKELNKYTNVPNKSSDIVRKCQQLIDEVFDVDIIEDMPDDLAISSIVTSSDKVLKFTLTKQKSSVVGSDYKIKLNNIFANYSTPDVLADINAIASDNDFIDQLTYDIPTMYGVAILDDGYDVEPISELDDAQFVDEYRSIAYEAILNQAYKFYYDCKYLEYTACGRDMSKIQMYTETYVWRLQEIIDIISKLIVSNKFKLSHPIERIKNDSCIPETLESYSDLNYWYNFIECMKKDTQDFLDVLTLYASNVSPETESMIQEWIRTWAYELNYVLTRSEY